MPKRVHGIGPRGGRSLIHDSDQRISQQEVDNANDQACVGALHCDLLI